MALEPKPKTAAGYSPDKTDACEQVLVTLLGAFGTLKSTLRLVGGLVPRYLTPESPEVPAHFGTSDVDMVLNLQLMADGEGYASLGQQLKERGFERYVNPLNGWSSGWRWMRRLSEHEYVLVEFLQGATAESPPGKARNVDGEDVAALPIEHAEIVHEWYEERLVTASLLDGGGISRETVRYADFTAFIILKALAFDSRTEPKDAGDLIHVMQYFGPPEAVAAQFIDRASTGLHQPAVDAALKALELRFCDCDDAEGFELTGPVSYAQFLYGKNEEDAEERMLAQRYASGLVMTVVDLIRRGLTSGSN
ncbi:hypothetical protein [Pseudomonas sp. CF161]|uniref:hypothetical protein n=1 Tax=Pseudomonas sp. CF161 TaxID=911241 RepID=UPI0005B911D4|nr:hypothetical protein [Pseudomonas sp. CF161]